MRIAHFSSPNSWRGGENQAAYAIQFFQEKGYDQFVVCPQNSPLWKWCIKHDIVCIPYKSGFLAARRLTIRLQPHKIDIVHTHDARALQAAYWCNHFWALDKPVIAHRRVDFPIGKKWISKLKYNSEYVKRIICVSKMIADICAPAIKDPESRIQVVYSGVDPSRALARKSQAYIRKELGIQADTPFLICIAALADHKDHNTLLFAFKMFLNTYPDAHLALVGEGKEYTAIVNLIKRLDIGAQTHIMGFRNDVAAFLSEADCFVLSSKTEGLGSSLADALFAECPVVATDAGGIPEIIQNEITGRLAPIQDPIELSKRMIACLQETDATLEFVENGKRHALKHFSAQIMAQSIESIYRKVLSA